MSNIRSKIMESYNIKTKISNDRSRQCQNKIVVPWVSTFRPGDKKLRKFVKEANSTLYMSPI